MSAYAQPHTCDAHSEANMKKEINIMILIDDVSDNMEASESS
jgi:hypothetical protein